MGEQKKKNHLWIVLLWVLSLCCFGGCSQEQKELSFPEDFERANIGVLTGSPWEQQAKDKFPDAKLFYFDAYPEMIFALQEGKIQSFFIDDSFLSAIYWETDQMRSVGDGLGDSEFAVVFADGRETIQNEVNLFIREMSESGALQALEEKWFGTVEPETGLSYESLTGENGVIKMAISATNRPFVYQKNGKYTGFDIELITRFCELYGYRLEFADLPFLSMLAGVESGKYDMAASGIGVTKERMETFAFSDVYHTGEIVMVAARMPNTIETEEKSSLQSLAESFEKTFIREDRWKRIAQGVGTTVLITVLSAAFGTALGFAIYLACRSGNRLARAAASIYSRLIDGLPVVVLLMILFYVVLGKLDIQGIWIAVLGFSLTTGSFVYGTMAVGVDSVDRGQMEAAQALGYTERRAFFKIILPQVMRPFISAYQVEMVALVKATAVVGYITVEDLTKASDIIRSNTYEAFFPLIATAAIYFLLTWLLTWLLKQAGKRFEPKRRRKGQILKGVNV